MSMFNLIVDFLYNISNVSLFLIISFFVMVFGLICLSIIKRLIPQKFQREEFGTLGNFLSSTIGGLHVIAAGFVLVYLEGNFNSAQMITSSEGTLLRRFADTVNLLPTPLNQEIFVNTSNYAKDILNHEWKLMRSGKKVDNKALSNLKNIIDKIKNYKTTDTLQLFFAEKIFNGVQEIYNIRYQRIQMSYNRLNSEYWAVIFITAFINLIFICMLGHRLSLHRLSIILTCISSASIIFLLIILNQPFRGKFSVSPDELQSSLQYIDQLQKNSI